MRKWEVDVELRVRKTLYFAGPGNEDAARQIAQMALTGGIDPSLLLKWTDPADGRRSVPVETFIDNDPQIVAIREYPDD